ncbi:MAG: hypothetical protein J6B71_05915 [Clostridia bacterium]|nr:hypothetical protein [Clostridia bacterium]
MKFILYIISKFHSIVKMQARFFCFFALFFDLEKKAEANTNVFAHFLRMTTAAAPFLFSRKFGLSGGINPKAEAIVRKARRYVKLPLKKCVKGF